MKYVILLLILFYADVAYCQKGKPKREPKTNSEKINTKVDSLKQKLFIKELNRQTKTALWAGVIPGGGQIYSKKYWKLPILYSVLFLGGLTIGTNHIEYVKARNALAYSTDADPATTPEQIDLQFTNFSTSGLRQRRDIRRRDRDYWIIITSIFYLLGLVEAVVDVHLAKFDVTDDITLNMKPEPLALPTGNYATYGLQVSYRF